MSTARALVKAGAIVEAKDDDGWTSLICASHQGHLTTVKFLVEEGHANVEAKRNDGSTPLINDRTKQLNNPKNIQV